MLVAPNGTPLSNGNGTTGWTDGDQVELLKERLAELELDIEDAGWRRIEAMGEWEFRRENLDTIINVCRLSSIKNPLIRRAVRVQSSYVFGQGVMVTGRDETVNDVIQDFLLRNRRALWSHPIRLLHERSLQTDGNRFLALFTQPNTGAVTVRRVPVEQIRERICDPEDESSVWYYKRVWSRSPVDLLTGAAAASVATTCYHPDWRVADGIAGAKHPAQINGIEVKVDVPLIHIDTAAVDSMWMQPPDVYSAVDWARAYKGYLEDWTTLVKALSQFAWRVKTKGSRLARTKSRLETTVGTGEGYERNPTRTAGSYYLDAGTELEPIAKTGAQPKAEDGLMLRKMAASGTDLPDTIIGADPDMGNLATAKTLDRPTELAMMDRQQLWAEAYRDLFEFVIRANAKSASGKLPPSIVRDDEITGEPIVGAGVATASVDTTIDIEFPPILSRDPKDDVEAIIEATKAGNSGPLPPEIVSRRLLTVLGVSDVDEIITKMGKEGAFDKPKKASPKPPPGAPTDPDDDPDDVEPEPAEEGASDAAAEGGIMVAWMVPDDIASRIAIEGGEPAEDLHLTLAYIGKVPELGDSATRVLADLSAAVSAVVSTAAPLQGTLSGVGRFDAPEGESDPVYASVDVPGLDSLRVKLTEALDAAGVPYAADHGFTPHVTLAYVLKKAIMLVPDFGGQQVTIDTLSVVVAGQRTDHRFGQEEAQEARDVPSVRPFSDEETAAITRMAAALEKALRAQAREAMAGFTGDLAAYRAKIPGLVRRWRQALEAAVSEETGAVTVRSAKAASQRWALGIDFAIDSPEVIAAVREHVVRLAGDVSGTSGKRVRKVITKAFRESLTPAKTRKALQAELRSWSDSRATTVARTEIIRASNAGTRLALETAKVRKLRWLAATDACRFCKAMNGRTIAITTEFLSLGDELVVAGTKTPMVIDYLPIAHPPLHPSCRCTITAVR